MGDDMVYSTKGGKQQKNQKKKAAPPAEGPLKMRLETKGRGGKEVTVLFNLPFTKQEAKQHMRAMQALFGCGATQKDGIIELRGDMRPKVESYCAERDLKVVRAGG